MDDGKGSRRKQRIRARAHAEMVRDLQRLDQLAPGGSPDRPIAVAAPSQIDGAAVRDPCPLCGGALRLEEHAVQVYDGRRLRVARVACTACGVRRERWYVLEPPLQ